jgi:hypothetical protein
LGAIFVTRITIGWISSEEEYMRALVLAIGKLKDTLRPEGMPLKSRNFGVIVRVALLIAFGTATVFSNPCSALEYEDGEMKMRLGDIKNFARTVKGTPYEQNRQELKAADRKFSAGQLSHKLRIMELTHDLIQHPEALAKFKELSILRDHAVQTIEQSETHDGAKSIPETRLANQGLSRAQGMNHRALSAGEDPYLPPDKAKQAAKMIVTSIHDVNVGEARIVNASFDRLSPNKEFVRVHSIVTEVFDYCDVTVNREDVGEGRKTALQWIEKLEADGVYKNEPPADVTFRKELAKFVEQDWKPQQTPNHYSKASDFLNLPGKDYKKVFKAEYEAKSKALIAKTAAEFKTVPVVAAATSTPTASEAADGAGSASQAAARQVGAKSLATGVGGRILQTASKLGAGALKLGEDAAKGSLVAVPVVSAINYLTSPEKSATDKGAALGGAVNDYVCASPQCHAFLTDCSVKIEKAVQDNPKKYPVLKKPFGEKDLFAHPGFDDVCVSEFLKFPLEEQMRQREDADLNRILSDYSPEIRNLNCSNTLAIEVEVQNSHRDKNNNQNYFQKLIYNSQRKVEKVERTSTAIKTQLIVNQGNHKILENCSEPQSCRKFEMDQLRNLNLYFWREEALATPTGQLNGRVPRESVQWARANEQLVDNHAAQIHRCCFKAQCKEFFANRAENNQKTAAQFRNILSGAQKVGVK